MEYIFEVETKNNQKVSRVYLYMSNNSVKAEILKEAVELFMRYGIKSVTMDDIARHLSISKKTIYQFFRDKEEIHRGPIELPKNRGVPWAGYFGG